MIRHGFIRLSREIMNWAWYDDIYASRLFMHLLLTANYEDMQWKGITIKAGQRVASTQTLANETGISRAGVQKILCRLEKSGEIERTVDNKITVITLKKYNELLCAETTSGQYADSENTSGTRKVAQCNNIRKEKNNNINNYSREKNNFSDCSSSSFTVEMLEQRAIERYRHLRNKKD